MSNRNHKELWEQLKVLVLYGKVSYTQKELCEIMSGMEIMQLTQDPLKGLLEALEPKEEKE